MVSHQIERHLYRESTNKASVTDYILILFVLILEKDFFILTMQMKIIFSNLEIEQIFINSEISLCEKQHIFIFCDKNEKNVENNRRETQQNNMLLNFY